MLGRGERDVGRGLVTEFRIDRDVDARVGPREQRARRDGGERMRDRRERLVIDGDQFGAVFRGGETLCHDHCNDFAAMMCLVDGHREMRRNERRRTVFVDERDVGRVPRADRMRDRPEPVIYEIATGQYR
jgi:hypothetical protein